VWARYSAPVQTGPGAHPASYSMGTGVFPGVKRPGRGVDNSPLSSAEVKERVDLYLYLWAYVTYSRVNFTFIPMVLRLNSHCRALCRKVRKFL